MRTLAGAMRPALTGLLLALAACGDGGGDPSPGPLTTDSLVGRASDPAVAAIPRLLYTPRADDFATDDPAFPGLPLAFNTVFAIVEPSATVGGVNAALRSAGARIVGGIPGRSGSAPGVLALRLETSSHAALVPVLALLRATPGLRVVTRDVVLRSDAVTRIGAENWAWERESSTDFGTWGLTAIRVPQLWNLNGQLAAASAQVTLGVLDEGFHLQHEDLVGRITADGTTRAATHGTLVGGIIAAGFNNGKGTDGVTPFARLVGRAIDFAGRDDQVTLGTATWGLAEIVRGHPELVAVNVSVGYNWSADEFPIDTRSNQPAREIADEQGRAVRGALEAIAATAPLPVIVASAGNDSRDLPDQEARFSSPFANAALEQGVAAIIVVEADSARTTSGAVDYVRSDFSNVGGHLSAPGSRITGPTSAPSGYGAASGTSFAAPLVTGVIGYLFGLEPSLPRPTLTTNPVRDLLLEAANRSASRNGRVQLDGFASALHLDLLTNSDRVLRRLLDIDDGTPDGNRRVDPVTKAEVTTDVPLLDDGRIDMADFRRWRDWLLQLEDPSGLALDGEIANLKRDVNGDGVVEVPLGEALFPRGDFNGDGRLSRTATAVVPGVLAARGALTDLQVLRARFEDPGYREADLDVLLDSGDLHVGLTACLAVPGAASVVLRVQDAGTQTLLQQRAVAQGTGATQVMTIPTGTTRNVRVVAEVRDAGANPLTSRDTTFTLALGADAAWAPACAPGPLQIVTTSLPGATAFVAYPGQALVASPSDNVRWSLVSGDALPPGMLLQSNGLISGVPTNVGSFTFTVQATRGQDVASRQFTLGATAPGCGDVLSGSPSIPTDAILAIVQNAGGVERNMSLGGTIANNVAFPCLTTVNGQLSLTVLSQRVSFPALTRVGGLSLVGNAGLVSAEFPVLSRVEQQPQPDGRRFSGAIAVSGNAVLSQLVIGPAVIVGPANVVNPSGGGLRLLQPLPALTSLAGLSSGITADTLFFSKFGAENSSFTRAEVQAAGARMSVGAVCELTNQSDITQKTC